MMTWNGAVAPALPPLTAFQRLRGALRLTALVALTVPVLTLFLLGRFLQRRVMRGVKFHFLVARLWARAMLLLIGVRREVIGAPMAAAGVWVSNHASWADILALRSARLVNFVSKAEVRHWPGVGLMARAADTVFIERRRSQAQAQRNELAERIRAGQLLCIFPEGTSSDGRRVLPFKSALFSALFHDGVTDAQVQPVTLNWVAPPGLPDSFFGWWGTMPFEGHIWDVLCRSGGGAVEIVFHPPRRVSEFADRKALARWAEDTVRGGLRAGSAAEAAP